MGRLEGRKALITGSASGIGAACAKRLAEEGAQVAGLDLQTSEEGDWAAAIQEAGSAPFRAVDVRDRESVEKAVRDLSEELGGIDILVNSAGVAGGGPIHLIDPAEWDLSLIHI